MKKSTFLKTTFFNVLLFIFSLNLWSATATLTITRSNFPDGALNYSIIDTWVAITSEGDTIKGEADLNSGAEQESIQINADKSISMFHNITPTPGPITRITLSRSLSQTTTRTFTAYMNKNSVITSKAAGTSKGKMILSANVPALLDLDKDEDWRYFWLNLEADAVYLTSIIIEYEIDTKIETPDINIISDTVTFSNVVVGKANDANEEIVEIKGSNLTDNILVSIAGTNADLFLTDKNILNSEGDNLYITYNPDIPGSHTAILILTSPGAEQKEISLVGYSILDVPVAVAANNISHNSFTANWNTVAGANEYILNVYTKSRVDSTVILSENFDGFTSGSPNGVASSTDISPILDNYTELPGWTGIKVYEAGGAVKIGTGSESGELTTPTMDLSANSGNFILSFDAMAWNNDQKLLKIYLNNNLIYTVNDLNNTDYIFTAYSVPLTGGTATSKIKFQANSASKGRFMLDNLIIYQKDEEIDLIPVTGSPFTASQNSIYIAGLEADTEYFYTVKAVCGEYISELSNEISVITNMDPGIDTGLNNPESNNLYVANGHIHFNSNVGERIEIYNSLGRLIYHNISKNIFNTITIDKGIWFIKIGNSVHKVIVK